MTRWKREFQEWIVREGLMAWVTPKGPENWHAAKTMSQMADHVARTPEFQQAMEQAMLDSITGNRDAGPSSMDRFLK